jgi:hypothetical protein
MDENLQVLLIAAGIGLVVGVVVAFARSERIRAYGLFGAVRRELSNRPH